MGVIDNTTDDKWGNEMNILNVINNFDFEGEYVSHEPYGMGHINDTFAVTMRRSDGSEHRYILQRMNKNIFKNVEELMRNLVMVTEHLKKVVVTRGGDPDREVLQIVKTRDNAPFLIDEDGEYWRSYILIENTIGYAIAEDAEMFEDAGRAFGTFIGDLAECPACELFEVIPNFHNTVSRFADFKKALECNYENRIAECQSEVDFVLAREQYCNKVVDMLATGALPLRVTHNDTKLNNVLMDVDTNRAVCVIDLDTIMPGSLLYDFGDAIRSGCNTGLEDEPDLAKVSFDINLFESFCKGFLSGIGSNITPAERDLLPFSAILMTYECGMRFLGDFLNGDTYFKIQYREHNLVRARTQFKMVADMERQLDDMLAIARRYCKVK